MDPPSMDRAAVTVNPVVNPDGAVLENIGKVNPVRAVSFFTVICPASTEYPVLSRFVATATSGNDPENVNPVPPNAPISTSGTPEMLTLGTDASIQSTTSTRGSW